VWNEPYEVRAYSTDGRDLTEAILIRQGDYTAPREDQYLYQTEIRPGGDVTGTLVFIAELDEEVSLELVEGLNDRKPEATWEFGPVGELPKREFEARLP
jgi:hypothetical protein